MDSASDLSIDLSIIIVCWNTRELLYQCLTSVFEHLPARPCEVWVIDNASKDGSLPMVRENFPSVHLLENRENVGFAAANNQVVPFCKGKYILLLNPDTVIQPQALERQLDYLDAHPEVGAVGPRLLNGDGTFQLSVFPFPTVLRELWRLLHLDRVVPFALYDLRKWDLTRSHEVDSIQGACLMLRQAVIQQVGLFDPDYFLYSEEIDLCFRIHTARWKLTWLPEVAVVHFGGQSSRQEAKKSFLNLYRGKMLFFRKNYGQFQAFLYRWVLVVTSIIRLAGFPLVWLEPPARREAHLKLAENYYSLLKAVAGF